MAGDAESTTKKSVTLPKWRGNIRKTSFGANFHSSIPVNPYRLVKLNNLIHIQMPISTSKVVLKILKP